MKQQQHPTNRGILPPETLNALDLLVDRLNASSGRLPVATNNNNNGNSSKSSPPLPIRALLVGTNEGVGLSRSFGTTTTTTATSLQQQQQTDGTITAAATTIDNSQSNNDNSNTTTMNEDVLGRIETVWATLVSAVPPHIMAAAAAAAVTTNNSASCTSTTSTNEEATTTHPPAPAPHYKQPSHPLLSPLCLGTTVNIVTATYINCNVVHVHTLAPLVITLITIPSANLGAIHAVAIPLLTVILEPVRRMLIRSRMTEQQQ